jgi:glycosyltransferase involved in cell wall biosynthesis
MTEVRAKPQPRLALVTGVLDLGGTTTFLCNFAGELLRRDIAAAVFSFKQDNPLAADFARLKIPVFTTDHGRQIYEDCLLRLLKEVRKFQPTIVVASLSVTSFEVLRYVPAGVVRIGAAQSHDPGLYRAIRPYAPYVDAMAAVSGAIKQTLESAPEFARVPIHYLPYGIPIPEPAPTRPSSPDAPLRILYLGRLEQEQKRVRLFPDILDNLKASRIPFHWTVAGEGSERAFLQEAMRSASATQTVSFPGKVLYGDVPKLLSQHDVFVLASDYEGLPLSLLEVMAAGLIPVVSDLPSGIREVVDETTGKRVDPSHVAGYAEAIVWIHEHREQMERLSRNAREKVRIKFSVSAMTDRWLEVLPDRLGASPTWPERWKLRPILGVVDPWRFSPPVRALRRILLKLRPARR